MKIKITPEDISRGRRCDPDCCPVGRALSRAGVPHYGVTKTAIMVAHHRNQATALPLPPVLKEWILRFDGGLPIAPLTFEINLATRKFGSRSVQQMG